MNLGATLWGSTLGDLPPGFAWSEVPPSGGNFVFHGGQTYAVLASVSKNYSVADVAGYMQKNGWTVSYTWEWGQALRSPPAAIDTWLSELTADPQDNHRWIYGEATRTATDDWTKGQSAPWPLTIYSIAHVFLAVPLPPGASPASPSVPALPPPGAQALPAPTSRSAPLSLGLGAIGIGAFLAWLGVRY